MLQSAMTARAAASGFLGLRVQSPLFRIKKAGKGFSAPARSLLSAPQEPRSNFGYQLAAKNSKIAGFDLYDLIWIGKIYWEFNG